MFVPKLEYCLDTILLLAIRIRWCLLRLISAVQNVIRKARWKHLEASKIDSSYLDDLTDVLKHCDSYPALCHSQTVQAIQVPICTYPPALTKLEISIPETIKLTRGDSGLSSFSNTFLCENEYCSARQYSLKKRKTTKYEIIDCLEWPPFNEGWIVIYM